MTIKEIYKDLFLMPCEYKLAHCISADFALGAGIAKQFCNLYNTRTDLLKVYKDKQYKDEIVGTILVTDNVINLVTKKMCYQKPTYESLKKSLEDMKKYCIDNNIKDIAMPKIGCGLDKLEWDKVKSIIFDVFKDTDINIVVCIKD